VREVCDECEGESASQVLGGLGVWEGTGGRPVENFVKGYAMELVEEFGVEG